MNTAMRHLALVICIVVCTLGLSPARLARAQADAWDLVPITTVATEQADGVDLAIYFTLRDRQGRVVPRDAAGIGQNDAAQLQMRTGPNTALQDAIVGDPQTPISIILLIDASGSMSNAIASVRAAAQRAVDAAPEGARFSVFRFSQVNLDQPFTPLVTQETNRTTVKQIIGGIEVEPRGMTCLFNAAYKALEHPDLQVDAAAGRRALILFTDGRDSNAQGNARCSSIAEPEVIAHALRYRTPLHTLGLCTDAACTDVDQPSLREMARETAGFAVFGEQAQIEESFQTIMAGISAQWVARARVLAAAGANRGTLEVVSRNRDQPLAGEFTFTSSRDYFLPPSIALTRQYDETTNRYELRLAIDNPQALQQLTVSVLDQQAGTLVGDPLRVPVQAAPDAQLTQTIPYPADQLISGADYCFQISAVDQQDRPVRLPAEQLSNGQDPTILAESCGQHRPTVRFAIIDVNANHTTGRLVARLQIDGLGTRQANIRGEILDRNGIQVGLIEPMVPGADQTITPPLPAALLSGAPAEYTLQLSLESGEQPLLAERRFANEPPPGPNRLLQAMLIGIPLLLAGIGLYFFMRRRPKPIDLPPPRPIRDADAPAPIVPPPVDRAPTTTPPVERVRVRVVQAPAERPPERVITQFPCTLGRDAHLLIPGDKKVGRKHLKLSINNGVLHLTDLDSTHGTFIAEQKIVPGKAIPIRERTHVRLGPETLLEIEPETK